MIINLLRQMRELSDDEKSFLVNSQAEVSRIAVNTLKIFMKRNEYFKFDNPIPGYGSYDIYAIANVRGIIMAEFISVGAMMDGDNTHELSPLGTDSSIAMMVAVGKYQNQEGTSEVHPEYENYIERFHF